VEDAVFPPRSISPFITERAMKPDSRDLCYLGIVAAATLVGLAIGSIHEHPLEGATIGGGAMFIVAMAAALLRLAMNEPAPAGQKVKVPLVQQPQPLANVVPVEGEGGDPPGEAPEGEAKKELDDESKLVIQRYMLKLVALPGVATAIASFALGYFIKEVAEKSAYADAIKQASLSTMDAVREATKESTKTIHTNLEETMKATAQAKSASEAAQTAKNNAETAVEAARAAAERARAAVAKANELVINVNWTEKSPNSTKLCRIWLV